MCFVVLFEGACLFGFGKQILNARDEGVAIYFSRLSPGDAACRVEQHQCGPCLDRIGRPEAAIVVQDDRVPDSVSGDGSRDALDLVLGWEFWGVYTQNRHGLASEMRLHGGKLGQDMLAVDAAVGPEVEQGDLSLQVFDGSGV